VGERVTAADGAGCWRAYSLASVTREVVRLAAVAATVTEPQPLTRLAVAFALTKGDKPELTVQKLTELGVDRIVPVLSARSVPRPGEDRSAATAARWERVARAAACQCRRARLVRVEALAPLGHLAGHPALVVAERGGPPAQALGRTRGAEVLVVVGPEGGFDDAEVAALGPWATLGLARHVLRAETAAIAAAALVADALARSESPPAALRRSAARKRH